MGLYLAMLLSIGWLTTRKKNIRAQQFFLSDKKTHWAVVTFGMIGTTISGVTFLSTPGLVYHDNFAYLQFVIGNVAGFWIIAYVLLKIYYQLGLTSIYEYLKWRFGRKTYQLGAFLFLLSRTLGASARVYIVVFTLYQIVLHQIGIPLWLMGAIIMILMLSYTYKGGVKTILWTDLVQTGILILCVVAMLYGFKECLALSWVDLFKRAYESGKMQIWYGGHPLDKNNGVFMLVTGILTTIAMVGLDQDMMQKNLTLKTYPEARKNMLIFSVIFLIMNFIFLCIGAFLYLITVQHPEFTVPTAKDKLFTQIVSTYFTPILFFIFVVGIIAATFASADAALTALTTSFAVDILKINEKYSDPYIQKRKVSQVQVGFAVVLWLCMLFFQFSEGSIIKTIFKLAGYTYAPLLSLYAVGILTQRSLPDKQIIWISVLIPVFVGVIDIFSPFFSRLIGVSYRLDFYHVLLLNSGAIFIVFWLFSQVKRGRG
ncbi:MAG: sodium:solute symporter [Bacteroidia bacterium]|nr:sodium:solute symporter [Bacteroidia bacterium]MDW8347451.1 sodium:solute symporter [Bacteroidia bacterium]